MWTNCFLNLQNLNFLHYKVFEENVVTDKCTNDLIRVLFLTLRYNALKRNIIKRTKIYSFNLLKLLIFLKLIIVQLDTILQQCVTVSQKR